MAWESRLSKVLMILLSVVLIVSTLGVRMDEVYSAPKNHTHYSTTYETVYAHPNASKEEVAILYALITLHPALKSYKYMKEAMIALGLWKAFRALLDREKKARAEEGYYIIEKKVYKAKKPTANYWGFSQTYIFSSVLREKIKGDAIVIGKTSY